jgi:hypothetical protein
MRTSLLAKAAAIGITAGIATAVLPATSAGAATSAVPLPLAHYSNLLVESFEVTDTPKVKGTATYRISYAGDAHLTAASASASVELNH